MCHNRASVGCTTNIVGTGDCYQRESLRVCFQITSKTSDVLPTNISINTPHNQVLGISNTRPRSFITYQPTSHHRAPGNQASQPKTTCPNSPPDLYLVEEENFYLFLSTDFYLFKINEIKSHFLIRCLLQPDACQ